MVYTDQNPGYPGLAKRNYRHEALNTVWENNIKVQAHTNGVESFWAMLKRGHMGVYHEMSKKHLQRYIDEYAGRRNIRPLWNRWALSSRGWRGKGLLAKS